MLRLRNAAQVVRVCAAGQTHKTGADMRNLEVLHNATVIVGTDGRITDVGPEEELGPKYADAHFDVDVDATGKSIIPGLVDGHTHPIWAGDRVHEFAMKLAGATYLDIHKAGGGIGFTVSHTRDARCASPARALDVPLSFPRGMIERERERERADGRVGGERLTDGGGQ